MSHLIRGLKIVSGSIMVGLWLVLLWQVFSRYVLKSPSTVTEELARVLLMWLGTLGAALGFLMHEHIAFDFVQDKASPRVRRKLIEVVDAISVVFGLMGLIGGVLLVSKTAELGQVTAVLGFPYWIIYTVVPIAGFFIALTPFAPKAQNPEIIDEGVV